MCSASLMYVGLDASIRSGLQMELSFPMLRTFVRLFLENDAYLRHTSQET